MLGLEFKQRLLFVTGKGGTGKTFLTAILGVIAAEQDKKVLLVDAEATGALASQFEHEPVGYEPVEVANNIFLMQEYTDEALSEYLNLNAKIPSWAKLTPLARLIDLVSNAAPGVREILIAGKICYEARLIEEGKSDFDVIIVDAPSSGHIISLLDAPRALSELVTRGMIQSQTQWMQDLMTDPETTGVLVSCLSDEVVMSETKDLVKLIEDSTNVAIEGIIVNKDFSLGIDPSQRSSVDKKLKSDRFIKLENYYLDKAQQSMNAIENFSNLNIYSFPQLSETNSTLRSLNKHSSELRKVSEPNS